MSLDPRSQFPAPHPPNSSDGSDPQKGTVLTRTPAAKSLGGWPDHQQNIRKIPRGFGVTCKGSIGKGGGVWDPKVVCQKKNGPNKTFKLNRIVENFQVPSKSLRTSNFWALGRPMAWAIWA